MYMLQRIVQLQNNFIIRVRPTWVQTSSSENYAIGYNYWKLIKFIF